MTTRLAYAALRVDTYLSILQGYPPSVRYQEINVPLPKSVRLWTAVDEDERRSLQWSEPAGREKARFSLMMRDAFDNKLRRCLPCLLTEEDYHLYLCALQAGIWEAGQKAHGTASDELFTDAMPREHVQSSRDQILLWRQSSDRDCQTIHDIFETGAINLSGRLFAYPSLVLYHLSSLDLHAPLRFFKGQIRNGKTMAMKDKSRLYEWATSSCARIAVWHTAQICHIIECQSSSPATKSRLSSIPFTSLGLAHSLLVTCFFALQNQAYCPSCGTSTVQGGPIHLFHARNEENPELGQWVEKGIGYPIWGSDNNETPLCKCQLTKLIDRFGQISRGRTTIDGRLISYFRDRVQQGQGP